MTEEEKNKLDLLVRAIFPDGRLLRSRPLAGGISAQMTAVEIEQEGGKIAQLVIRRPGQAALARRRDAAAREFRILDALHLAGMPTPRPIYLDESGSILPTPYLVTEYIEGAPQYSPEDTDLFTREMAACLLEIHGLGARVDLSILPRQEPRLARMLKKPPAKLDHSIGEGNIRARLEPLWPHLRQNEPVFLHGDFWPGNVLWKDEKVAGIIDWEDAEMGDPLYEIAITRLDIMWLLGFEAMQRFTEHYRSGAAIDLANLPFWDLCAALRPALKLGEWAEDWPALGRADITEASIRKGHRLFVQQAMDKLSQG